MQRTRLAEAVSLGVANAVAASYHLTLRSLGLHNDTRSFNYYCYRRCVSVQGPNARDADRDSCLFITSGRLLLLSRLLRELCELPPSLAGLAFSLITSLYVQL